MPVVISNGARALHMCSKRIRPIARLRTRAQVVSAAGVSACAPGVSRFLSLHAYIQQSGRSLKSMNAKHTKISRIHENADANITCDFGDGDISRYRSRLPHTTPDGQAVSSILVRCTIVCALVAFIHTNR